MYAITPVTVTCFVAVDVTCFAAVAVTCHVSVAGKFVPEEAVKEMKANYVLPSEHEPFVDEVM